MDFGLEFAADVSLLVAFVAGVFSFFSPCILPLIPVYIMYMTGASIEDELENRRMLALTRTFGFVIGFTIIFVIMGISISLLGNIFARNKAILGKFSGALIVVFGLNMMGILKFNFINLGGKFKAPKKMTNWFSSVLMGMAFATGWTPCFGPVVGSILAYVGVSETLSRGIFLLLIYSLGMAIPFILTALFINQFNKMMIKAERFIDYIPKIGGFIMVIFGILVFFDKLVNINKLFL